MKHMAVHQSHQEWDPAFIRQRVFAQDKRLIAAAKHLANKIRSVPRDARYQDVEPRTLIIGGFVRDAILGGQPKDLDLEVYGVAPEHLEEILNQLYPNSVNTVGRSFGILKVHLGEDMEFDVSIPRHESKTAPGHRGFAVTGDPDMQIYEALRRRDFTINALAIDPITEEVIDVYGGLNDLKRRVLRVLDAERFPDDPLRVYRAIQLVGRFELNVEPHTLELMREIVSRGDLEELPRERVTDELKKLLLKSMKPSLGFACAKELGLIEKYFPELHALVGTPQEPEWHPEGDVWTHTLMVIDHAAALAADPMYEFSTEERLQIIFGALCHDLGKPITTARIDGRIRSRGHQEAGIAPVRSLCSRLTLSDSIVHAALAIAKDHLQPALLAREIENGRMNETQYANAVRKLLKRIHPLSWRAFLAASEADFYGRGVPNTKHGPYLYGERFAASIKREQLDIEPTKPLIQGRDLLALGLRPGPRIGEIIARIEALRDAGTITTHEEAMERARALLR